MYDDNEGPSSFYLAFKGALAIAAIIAFIYVIYLFISRLKQRKLRLTITDILKLIWMISSVTMLIYILTLFLPEFSIEAANEKFTELMPFKRGLLGAVTSIVVAFLITIFCMLGIASYFEKAKKKDNNLNGPC